jgi:predicted nuclease of predicted toxin-antitoxin system
VKLLLDQNLSPRLVPSLADLYPDSAHVQTLGLDTATDADLWTYARTNAFTILTKDEDFNDLVLLRGFPPKIIWLQLGNCTTTQIESALRARSSQIQSFETDPNAGTFVLR